MGSCSCDPGDVRCTSTYGPVLVDFVQYGGSNLMNVSRLRLEPWIDLYAVKCRLLVCLELSNSATSKDIRFVHRGLELPNSLRVSDIDFSRRNRIHWAFKGSSGESSPGIRLINTIEDVTTMSDTPRKKMVSFSREMPLTKRLLQLVREAVVSFKNNIHPRLTMEGSGGAYLIGNRSTGQPIAIFKPRDEEPFAPFNPRIMTGKLGQQGIRAGVRSGECASREVAAFLLDFSQDRRHFANVPLTTLLEASHHAFCNPQGVDPPSWKQGSFQAFVHSDGSCGDFDPKHFFTVDVQRIAILDIRVANLDRNDGNILVKKQEETITTNNANIKKFRLIPIDHGLILPDQLDVASIDLAWLEWPQVKKPIGAEELEFIRLLNPEKDAKRLQRKLGIREECLRTLRVTTRLLKIGTLDYRLTLRQVGEILCRDDLDKPSHLERIVKRALYSAVVASQQRCEMVSCRFGLAVDLQVPPQMQKATHRLIITSSDDNSPTGAGTSSLLQQISSVPSRRGAADTERAIDLNCSGSTLVSGKCLSFELTDLDSMTCFVGDDSGSTFRNQPFSPESAGTRSEETLSPYGLPNTHTLDDEITEDRKEYADAAVIDSKCVPPPDEPEELNDVEDDCEDDGIFSLDDEDEDEDEDEDKYEDFDRERCFDGEVTPPISTALHLQDIKRCFWSDRSKREIKQAPLHRRPFAFRKLERSKSSRVSKPETSLWSVLDANGEEHAETWTSDLDRDFFHFLEAELRCHIELTHPNFSSYPCAISSVPMTTGFPYLCSPKARCTPEPKQQREIGPFTLVGGCQKFHTSREEGHS
eukprot:TRINITY_DN89976_c3_g1_i2.p1 TRINITY_DN89976_c3_g1~~TRINITY_DN89976_c3_g1_i2.p1  ORF type:complete len:813 (-),score=88.87 TRINITY_DN89976_c3_g1_i2:139-2577(-)